MTVVQDYASALVPMGCQTVDDLLNPQKQQLIELNVKDPEHRHRLLAAAEHIHAQGGRSRLYLKENMSKEMMMLINKVSLHRL